MITTKQLKERRKQKQVDDILSIIHNQVLAADDDSKRSISIDATNWSGGAFDLVRDQLLQCGYLVETSRGGFQQGGRNSWVRLSIRWS